jgi:hypothetical protein
MSNLFRAGDGLEVKHYPNSGSAGNAVIVGIVDFNVVQVNE